MKCLQSYSSKCEYVLDHIIQSKCDVSYGGIISKAALCFGFMMPGVKFVVVKMCSDSCDSSRETFFSSNSRTTLKRSRMLPPCGLYWYSSHSVNLPSQTLQTRNTLMKGFPSEVDNKILFNGHNAPYLKTNYNFKF